MTVIVGSGQENKKKRWTLILSIVAILILAGCAGVGLRMWQTRNQDKADTVSAPKLPQTVGDLQNLRAVGDDAAFDDKLADALANPDLDKESRYMLYLQQGHGFVDKQQWQAAIDAYLNAGKIRNTYEVADLLAETYRSAGNKAKAIEYYKKAITLIPDSPVKETDKTALELKIRELEEQS